MDGRDHHLQSFGICQRLHKFMRSLVSRFLKLVTSGLPLKEGSHPIPHPAIQNEVCTICNRVHPAAGLYFPSEDIEEGSALDATATRAKEETGTQLPSAPSRTRPPKRSVSINDEVEDIEKTMKLRRKNKSFEKSFSLELLNDEPKRTRSSILKVGSDLSKKMTTFVTHKS